ncbi:hypothetical protein H2248_002844 [Termitomyces sp. 'cryptogamus']|nr:hypothetical protein H2248_002844 [Termitomyces sp. 'cryptogamus']
MISVGPKENPANVVTISKLAESGLSCTFLITPRDDFQTIARISHSVTIPKYYAVANEVAAREFLRSSGLPVPSIYVYLPDSDNAGGTEYIFMELIRGFKLSNVWPSLGE